MSKHARRNTVPGRHGLAAGALTVSGFAASLLTPAHALVLGDVAVESALGQPLNARIPVQLGPGEMLGSACVSLPTTARNDLSALPRPVVTMPEAPGAGSFDLRITTSQPLYEPMYELQVQVRCPGTALMVRQYVLMLDLPGMAGATPVAATPSVQASESVAPTAPAAAPPAAAPAPVSRASRPVRPRPHPLPGAAITSGTRYRVVAGDTLSTIAARVGARGSHGIWKLSDEIFAANPGAFIGGNPDLIKLGSEIVIPVAAGAAAPVAADASAPPAAAAAAVTPMPAPGTTPAPTPAATVADTTAEPSGAEPDVAATDTATEPVATVPPVFQDEAPAAEAPVEEPAEAAAPPPAVAPTRSGAPPWLAALIGVLIGAAVSMVLLRDRLVAALGGLLALRKPAIEPMISAPAAAPAARPPQFNKPFVAREPSMVVEEHHEADVDTDSLSRTDESLTLDQPVPAARAAAPATSHDDQDLASLFGQEPDLPLFDDATGALPSADELDLDLSAAAGDATVDEDIGWIGDETALTPTAQASALPGGGAADTVEHIDLQTLSQRAGDDAAISQTLKDALNLLESDYEDELTASQVVDRNQLERMLEDTDSEDTMVRTGTDQMPRRR